MTTGPAHPHAPAHGERWQSDLPLAHRALEAVRSASEHLASRQEPDGHWAGDYGGPMFLMPGLLIAQQITGFELSAQRHDGMVTYLSNHQNDDGGWGLHILGPSTMLGTGLNYAALRILGVAADDPRAERARNWIHENGGAESIPTWGKLWFSVLGLYRYSGMNPMPPELWLLPRWMPMHPGSFWCHTRAIFLPMSYLYGRRAVAPETELVRELRHEMFVTPWEDIDWPSLRERVCPLDLYTPHTPLLKLLNRGLLAYERAAEPRLRARALAETLELMRHEDATTGHLTIGPVSKALHMVAIWFAEGESASFKRHVERVDDYLWDADDGTKMQGYNGSQLWDLAFAMLAILESGLPEQGELLEVLRNAHHFLDANQIRDNVPDHARYHRDATEGAWPFSTREQSWSVSDCTAEGLKVALKMEALVDAPIPLSRLRKSVDRLLESQNRDGGWSEYERSRGSSLLELVNPAECFGDIMVGYSYVECTSACIQALTTFTRRAPGYRADPIRAAVARGADFIRGKQRADGSWYGGWAICFTYGTWFAIEGLLAAGEPRGSERLSQAERFLWDHQRADGGWGESWRACTEHRWIDADDSQVVQSAWALLGLMALRSDRQRIDRGIALLLERQRADGDWNQEEISGVFNRSCMIHYDNYRSVMPLWALARYGRLFGERA